MSEAEQDQLELIIADAYDRPATWAQNLLCFHYDRCRAPLTGGDDEGPKSLQASNAPQTMTTTRIMQVVPNPATAWAACTYDLGAEPDGAFIIVKDAMGRTVQTTKVGAAKGQIVLDTRSFANGLYTVELLNAGRTLQVEKLMVE
ncbi:MAG: T9SS type A sorting domain-containing protein [Flavobacteriales bacterium]|nr:T9SS type A sorting domain-containing protein [Flavobacteriales bacterium]